jgi:hypothetical protein
MANLAMLIGTRMRNEQEFDIFVLIVLLKMSKGKKTD